MDVKERVLALRLMEKLERNCEYAERIGVEFDGSTYGKCEGFDEEQHQS